MSKHVLSTCGLSVLFLVVGAKPSQATVIPLTAKIEGSQEVPPRPSPAFGTGVFEYDTATKVLSWKVLYTPSLLLGAETGAHIHGPAPVGQNAGVLIPLSLGDLKQGSINITTVANATEADLLNRLWYVNIHSSVYTGGEIRGQIVPEPASLMLLASGGLILFIRRRQRA